MPLRRLIYLSTVRGLFTCLLFRGDIRVGGNTFIERALDDAQLLNLFRCRLDDLFALLLIAAFGVNEEFK